VRIFGQKKSEQLLPHLAGRGSTERGRADQGTRLDRAVRRDRELQRRYRARAHYAVIEDLGRTVCFWNFTSLPVGSASSQLRPLCDNWFLFRSEPFSGLRFLPLLPAALLLHLVSRADK
jgi:hypothetical protein